MTAPAHVIELVEHFQDNMPALRSGRYNETMVRREFIDPLFVALGWDVANEGRQSEAYKDVIHEDSVEIEGRKKAPDYSFRVGGTRRFFVEAKKPSVSLAHDPLPAFQLRRYGWSASLPVSILTDFEEFVVYDCRVEPVKTDKASAAQLMYVRFDQYADRWREIADVFARPAVLDGSLDKYAEANRTKRGSVTVDVAFLREIEGWRDRLARDLARRNPGLGQRELNYAVQMTIDRIIFLRIAEDRGIEPYGRLRALTMGDQVYERFVQVFIQADARYNSGLFHFKTERGRAEDPDGLTLGLHVGDDVLRDMTRGLYFPDSPYAFDVLPTEILGQVYEQFLGKVITLDAGHNAVVEAKPEVRKAGGVYYTPAYIVDYIVRHTVGRLVEGQTPAQARGTTTDDRRRTTVETRHVASLPATGRASLRILDPACGSGSFLLGAYQFLLDWYRDQYVAEGPAKHKRALYQTAGGEWRLSTQERKRILLDHIYGVDIDAQAVEVTKLSLLLKVLEGESGDSLNRQLTLLGTERALPDLSANIKCGNALIGPDFYEGQQMRLLDEEEVRRVNAFDWRAEFPHVFSGDNPGFDAVIGNPPYIRIQTMKEWAPLEVELYKQMYHAASKGNYDIYVVFVERGLSLLNATGRLGFILPHKFFNAQYGQPLRELLSQGRHLAEVVHFGDQQIFAGATTYTALMFLDKAGRDVFDFAKVEDLDVWRRRGISEEGKIPLQLLAVHEWNFSLGNNGALLGKLRELPVKLEDVTHRIFQGIKTSADKIYIVEECGRSSQYVKACCLTHP